MNTNDERNLPAGPSTVSRAPVGNWTAPNFLPSSTHCSTRLTRLTPVHDEVNP